MIGSAFKLRGKIGGSLGEHSLEDFLVHHLLRQELPSRNSYSRLHCCMLCVTKNAKLAEPSTAYASCHGVATPQTKHGQRTLAATLELRLPKPEYSVPVS